MTAMYFNQVNNMEIDLLLEDVIQTIIIIILANNKPSQNRNLGTVICRLVRKIIVPRYIIIVPRNHWRSSEVAGTTMTIIVRPLISNSFLGLMLSRWSKWWACWAWISVAMLMLRFRTIPPDDRTSFQTDYIASWNPNFCSEYLVFNFGKDIRANMLCYKSPLKCSGIFNMELHLGISEKPHKLGRGWDWREADLSGTWQTSVVRARAVGIVVVDGLRVPEDKRLASVWRRRTDVIKLMSGAGFGDGGGCEAAFWACALCAGCRNSALLAASNEGMLGGMFNGAWPSSYRIIRFFWCGFMKLHTKAQALSSTMAGVSGIVAPDGAIYMRWLPSSFL